MSDNKKYYYLKLKDTFFDSEEMKILESQKNGILYQNIYLKLCLLSVKNNGALTFKEVMPYDVAMLSTILRIDIDSVKTAIEIFIKLGLVVISDNETMYMSDIQSLIGQSSTEADRIKDYRNKLKCTNEVQMLQNCTPEKEKEKEKEKDINTPPSDEGKGKTKKLDDNAIELANLLYRECKKQNDKFKATVIQLRNWASDIEKINRIDGYDYSTIKEVLVWCKNDDFWSANIQSGAKFRKQFTVLILRSKKNADKKTCNKYETECMRAEKDNDFYEEGAF